MNRKISDVELLTKIKQEDKWALIQLWQRYQPVVHKRSNYMMKVVYLSYEKEDLLQEFFLSFLDAVEYVDMDKIPSSSFHFSTIFFYFLRNKEAKIKKKYFRNIKNIEFGDYEELIEPDKEKRTLEFGGGTHFTFNEEAILLSRIDLPLFRKILSEKQNEILSHLLQDRKIKDISRVTGEKYMRVYHNVVAIREKAKSFFEGAN